MTKIQKCLEDAKVAASLQKEGRAGEMNYAQTLGLVVIGRVTDLVTQLRAAGMSKRADVEWILDALAEGIEAGPESEIVRAHDALRNHAVLLCS